MEKLNINEGIKEFLKNKNAVLLDVRTEEEYNQGHIEGSLNVPIQSLDKVRMKIKDLKTPVYVYCRSGIRSAKAANLLRQSGYIYVKNIGGTMDY